MRYLKTLSDHLLKLLISSLEDNLSFNNILTTLRRHSYRMKISRTLWIYFFKLLILFKLHHVSSIRSFIEARSLALVDDIIEDILNIRIIIR